MVSHVFMSVKRLELYTLNMYNLLYVSYLTKIITVTNGQRKLITQIQLRPQLRLKTMNVLVYKSVKRHTFFWSSMLGAESQKQRMWNLLGTRLAIFQRSQITVKTVVSANQWEGFVSEWKTQFYAVYSLMHKDWRKNSVLPWEGAHFITCCLCY